MTLIKAGKENRALPVSGFEPRTLITDPFNRSTTSVLVWLKMMCLILKVARHLILKRIFVILPLKTVLQTKQSKTNKQQEQLKKERKKERKKESKKIKEERKALLTA